ncbi:hypothetical protein GQX73_g6197 [Xylaria multiplex]|uniref:Rhodopsin domain-containing protein n=1 Tax=Xylaria multiplex TaxID=323545 RepID=A0A7C8IME3_9PEZI|nr:hypothetical protein GQX73_g6197 [Xylaria multiplex]
MDFDTPALEPPPGIQPNFDNPPNGNVQAHFGLAICIFLVFTGASLRAYSKIFCMKQAHLEDYVGLLALGPYIGFVYGVYYLMRTTGIYVHQWNIRASTVPSALYIVYINTALFQATIGTVKTAILLDWTRTFVPRGRTSFWWTCQIVMWANIVYYIVVTITSAISCSPREKIWHPTTPGTCFNTRVFFVTNASLNLASDILILALPHRVIWNLKMSTQKKIGVSLVFAVGVIACLVGAHLYLRLSPRKIRLAGSSEVSQKLSTWNSSVFGRGPTLEAGWDQPPNEPKLEQVQAASHSTLELHAPKAMKPCVLCTTSRRAPDPHVRDTRPHVWPSRHDPTTSWYEEGTGTPEP